MNKHEVNLVDAASQHQSVLIALTKLSLSICIIDKRYNRATRLIFANYIHLNKVVDRIVLRCLRQSKFESTDAICSDLLAQNVQKTYFLFT